MFGTSIFRAKVRKVNVTNCNSKTKNIESKLYEPKNVIQQQENVNGIERLKDSKLNQMNQVI